MNVKLDRAQGILLVTVLFLLLVGGGLGWEGLGRMSEQLASARQLAERRANGDLSIILSRPSGINIARKETDDLIKLCRELEKTEEAVIGPWRKGWEEASGEGMDWSKDPNKWKDKLVQDNDEILKKCGVAGDLSKVILGEDFYLGLQEYRQKSPGAEQVPALARQLSVSKKLVDILIEAKKTREGYATPCVLVGIEVPMVVEISGREPEKPKNRPEEKSGETLRERYRMKIACSPEVLYEFIRILNQDPWLFILVNMSLTNPVDSFPKRGEVAKLFETAPTPAAEDQKLGYIRGSTNESSKPKLLLVLSGKEKVDVNLEIDYVGWRSLAPMGKKEEAKK